jgi:DNA-binding response OmpR family regulator
MSHPVGAPILLLEDERSTASMIIQLIAAACIANPVEWMEDGGSARGYLDRSVAEPALRPVLCVLDLSLPDVNGLEVLKHIRGESALADLPVIMLSGSGEDADIDAAYGIGIDAYLVKPAGVYGLPDVIRELKLSSQLLPRSSRNGA